MPMLLWNQDLPGIHIVSEPNSPFFQMVNHDLNLIRSRNIGRDLLSLISARTRGIGTGVLAAGKSDEFKAVMIRKTPATKPRKAPDATWAQPYPAAPEPTFRREIPGSRIRKAGAGTSVFVNYDPSVEEEYTRKLDLYSPTFIVLAHELCHAWHFLSGDQRHFEKRKLADIHEEARTVGLGIYANTRISENAIRREWGLPTRTFYANPGDCDDLASPP